MCSATFTQNEVIFSDVLHASDQMYPTRVLRMHLEDELDNVLREQILERERAGKSNVDSGSDSDPEDDHDATGAVKQERFELLMKALRCTFFKGAFMFFY